VAQGRVSLQDIEDGEGRELAYKPNLHGKLGLQMRKRESTNRSAEVGGSGGGGGGLGGGGGGEKEGQLVGGRN